VNRDEIRKAVEEELRRVLADEPKPQGAPRIARWLTDPSLSRDGGRPPVAPSPSPAVVAPGGSRIEEPANPEALGRFLASTPSRIGVGRAGTRYLTEVYIGLRADHAIAKDAVYSETEDGFPERLSCLPLHSQCKDRQEFLLYPAHGRRLDDASKALLASEGTKGADVQIIVGDGLSAWAAKANMPELLPCLQKELTAAGFSLGRPVYVRLARVGVQDEIGVLLAARATLICLGERPGLGTGDSLSIYLAYGPKLDQDNAEKNCISNVRKLGLLPAEAAREAAAVLKRAFAVGGGGVRAK
jgi:ethanolamine ammonia-lyase small subunit